MDSCAELRLADLVTRVRDAITAALTPDLRIWGGWPFWLDSGSHLASGAGIAVHLASAQAGSRQVVWLEAPLAVCLVERVLGVSISGAAAHATLNLRSAEQGVLAYVAAKIARTFPELRVTDVTAETPVATRAVAFPVAVEVGQIRSAALCVWLDDRVPHGAAHVCTELSLWLDEELDHADLASLHQGDLLCFEPGALRAHGERLFGTVLASFDGAEQPQQALIEGDTIVSRGAPPANRPYAPVNQAHAPVRIELIRQRVTIEQLARFGARLPITLASRPDQVTLCRAGSEFAKGELVRHRGQIAVRVTQR